VPNQDRDLDRIVNGRDGSAWFNTDHYRTFHRIRRRWRTTVNLDEFLLQAADYGPCVGVHTETPSPLVPPDGVEVRTIEGAHTKSLDALFDAFAEAWHFPPWFGRNRDAFDDFMRDFDNLINTATGKPPAPGYLIDITDAHLLLVEQPDLFSWFANTMPFYRDYYRAKPARRRPLACCFPHPRINSTKFANVG
jgi:hypothetical protein